MDKERSRTITLLVSLLVGFVVLIGYMSYFQIFKADIIKNNAYNKRLWIDEESIVRGSIFDRNGEVLAYSEKQDDRINRIYKYDYLYSHIIGYSLRDYGKAGLEKNYNNYLINSKSSIGLDEVIDIINPQEIGNNLILTVDNGLQSLSKKLLQGKKGTIITMNPSNGEIFSMVSMPDFNVNTLSEDWSFVSVDKESPLLNRATQGLYAPGSIFKIVTALSIIENNEEAEYNCLGHIDIDGYIINDFGDKAHGEIGLDEAFVYSCNTYFANFATRLGYDKLKDTAESMLFNKNISFGLDVKESNFPKSSSGKTELAASGIGQGRILVTPLNMLLITSAIANDGKIISPTIVKEIKSPNDALIYENEQITITNLQINDTNRVKTMMRSVVEKGTGTKAYINGISVSGKTGTAQNSKGLNDIWFVGFAPYDQPKISVVVLIEDQTSTGGELAAPIAKELINYALKNIDFSE
ncbi:MAG: penicillin-binding transpeptidase domain-containing protein [Gudongella sp.]|nr:penicillin-binding transpeptidase domain-containing protein [Gudongella sp.]